MFMAQAFVVDTQQSGSARRRQIVLRQLVHGLRAHSSAAAAWRCTAMLSLDPATVTNRRYPLLFQTGETAYGQAPWWTRSIRTIS